MSARSLSASLKPGSAVLYRTFVRVCANRMQPARVAFPLQSAEKNV